MDIGVFLPGSEAEPLHDFGQGFGYAIASGVYVTEVRLGINIPLLGEAAHAIRSVPLVSQRPISVSIQLRWLYHFRVRQDRDSALQQAPDADWTKMVDERWRGSAWLEHLRDNSPATASEELVEGAIGYSTDNGRLCSLTVW